MIQKPMFVTEAQIIAKLEQAYGLRATALHFLPIGEASWCYRAEAGGKNWFIKLVKQQFYPASILIPNALHVDFVNPALPNRQGHLWDTLMEHTVVAFPVLQRAIRMYLQ